MENSKKSSSNYSNSTPNWIAAIATLVIAGTAIYGIVYLILEFDENQKQTVLMRSTIEETFKPIGIFKQYTVDNQLDSRQVIIGFDNGKLSYNPYLINAGKGLMVYLGHIYYLSEEEINFREGFFNGDIKNYIFDGYDNYSRRFPILQNEKLPIVNIVQDIGFESGIYYLNILVFYEDSFGNLHDTEVELIIPFGTPKITPEGLKPNLLIENIGKNEQYHKFQEEEKEKLILRFRERKHAFSEIFN